MLRLKGSLDHQDEELDFIPGTNGLGKGFKDRQSRKIIAKPAVDHNKIKECFSKVF
jgi:hypothetical protein